MTTLTIEAIRENPWSVVTHSLPPHPSRLLLALAYLAADYCRRSEHLLVRSARDGTYWPLKPDVANGVNPGSESARRIQEVHQRIRELCTHCESDGASYVLRL